MDSDDFFNFLCPHCGVSIQVHKNEINCGIFRCAVFKKHCGNYGPGQQSNPHASKAELEDFKRNDCYWGCGKPFRVKKLSDFNVHVETCGYI